MSETPDIAPIDPDIPEEAVPAGAGAPEVEDQPLGVPGEADADDAPLPGLPQAEPPASE